MLLDHGAGKTPLPLGAALLAGCTPCFELLLKLAEPGDLNGALTAAVRLGDLPVTRMLLERGAKPVPNILQTVALSETTIPVDAIQTLIAPARTSTPRPAGHHFRIREQARENDAGRTRSAELASRIKAPFLRC